MFLSDTAHEIALWAFGDTWPDFLARKADSRDLFIAWNVLHGDLFILKDGDKIRDAIAKIKLFYLKQKGTNERKPPRTKASTKNAKRKK